MPYFNEKAIYLIIHFIQGHHTQQLITLFLFCFVALRPKSTAKVIAGRSVYLITLFPGQA